MAAPIIIFGASGGVGEALARRLATGPTPLVLTGRNARTVGALAEEIGARHAVVDVLDGGTIDAAVAAADTGEGIAGIAYCVGTFQLKPIGGIEEHEFIDAFRINVVGAARAVRAAETGLKRARGSVVLFSTVAVAQGFPRHAVIAAAKGGVEGLALSLAAELAPHVRVNTIAPSLTRTPLVSSLTQVEKLATGIAQLHPLARLGEAEDIAAAAAFLLGPDSTWMTGQVIGVDGGRGTLRTKG